MIGLTRRRCGRCGACGVDENWVGKDQSFYVEIRTCVRIGSKVSAWFPPKVRLIQGCVMDSRLFNLYMEEVVREVKASVLGRNIELCSANGRNRQFNQLLFTDETAVVT